MSVTTVPPASSASAPAGAPPASPPAPAPPASATPDRPWGAIVVMAGLLAIVAVFVVAALQYKTAADVTTAVGAVSGVIAALVGAYFGIRGATLAQSNAESPPKAPSSKV